MLACARFTVRNNCLLLRLGDPSPDRELQRERGVNGTEYEACVCCYSHVCCNLQVDSAYAADCFVI